MKLALLFVLTSVGGAIGKLAGLFGGAAVAPGLGLLLQFILGALGLIASVLVAERLDAIRPHQRRWTCLGGVLGVGMGTLVTLSTLSSPIAPFLVPLMIGMGATLGSLIGKSAHERADLT
jgi:hypothetical protein